MNAINALNALNDLNGANNVNNISFQTTYTQPKSNPAEKSSKGSFEGFFDAAVKLLEETNRLQIADERMALDYAAGKIDDELAVVLAQQKAYSALNFTVQVTNRIIEAYREIMRISM